jgi:hypothetical protein
VRAAYRLELRALLFGKSLGRGSVGPDGILIDGVASLRRAQRSYSLLAQSVPLCSHATVDRFTTLEC